MLEFHFWSGKNLPKLDLKLNKKVVVYTENRLKIDHHSFHEKGNPYHCGCNESRKTYVLKSTIIYPKLLRFSLLIKLNTFFSI